VAAAAPGGTVLVCPGTYPEQVVITQPLTLRGLTLGIFGNQPVITVPVGGELTIDQWGLAVQLQVAIVSGSGPVNINELVIDGTGAETGAVPLLGMYYTNASGTVTNLTVRNQNPGSGIEFAGSDDYFDTVALNNSTVENFSGTGIEVASMGPDNFVGNLTSNSISSAMPNVVGIYYNFSDGTAQRNTITLTGGGEFTVGLLMGIYFENMTARYNTISGAAVGISAGSGYLANTTIVHNTLVNNAVGIGLTADDSAPIINSNSITNSNVAGIDLGCNAYSTIEGNTFFGAPVGIANEALGDRVAGNTYYNVPTKITVCP
jgi:nitrous oxidase accessory protein NosD